MKNPLKKILGAFSFATAMFIFQACYGAPQDTEMDVCVSGTVFSSDDNTPVKGIKILTDNNLTAVTDDSGRFFIYTLPIDSLKLSFNDIDSIDQFEFETYDTILTGVNNNVNINIILNKK